MRQIRIHIQRHAVQRHPLLHANANGGDLVLVPAALFVPAHPNANAILAPFGAHVEGGEGTYDPFLERGDETADIRTAPPEIEHHVSDPLARPMIRQLAPAPAGMDRKTRLDCVGRICTGAGGVERRVLQEPDEFGGRSGDDFGRADLHSGDRLLVRHRGIADAPFGRHRSGRRRKPDYQRVSRINHSFTIP